MENFIFCAVFVIFCIKKKESKEANSNTDFNSCFIIKKFGNTNLDNFPK